MKDQVSVDEEQSWNRSVLSGCRQYGNKDITSRKEAKSGEKYGVLLRVPYDKIKQDVKADFPESGTYRRKG